MSRHWGCLQSCISCCDFIIIILWLPIFLQFYSALNSLLPVDDFEFRTEQFLPVSTCFASAQGLLLKLRRYSQWLFPTPHSTWSPYLVCSSSCCSRWQSVTPKCRCSMSSPALLKESTRRWGLADSEAVNLSFFFFFKQKNVFERDPAVQSAAAAAAAAAA